MTSALLAKVGGRVSHAPTLASGSGAGLLGAVMGGSVVGPAGLGGAASARTGQGLGAPGMSGLVPLATHGALGAPLPVLRPGAAGRAVQALVPHVVCALHPELGPQPVLPTQAAVSVAGLPVAVVGDVLPCGAIVCDGVEHLSVESEPSSSGSAPTGVPLLLSGSLAGVAWGASISRSTPVAASARRARELCAHSARPSGDGVPASEPSPAVGAGPSSASVASAAAALGGALGTLWPVATSARLGAG
jgi:hypothetical protein